MSGMELAFHPRASVIGWSYPNFRPKLEPIHGTNVLIRPFHFSHIIYTYFI